MPTFSIYKYNGIRPNCCNTRCQRSAIGDEAKVSCLTRNPVDQVTFSTDIGQVLTQEWYFLQQETM